MMKKYTRRMYMISWLVLNDPEGAGTWADVFMAMEAVSSLAVAHPEWDMAEEKTWEEWEAEHVRNNLGATLTKPNRLS